MLVHKKKKKDVRKDIPNIFVWCKEAAEITFQEVNCKLYLDQFIHYLMSSGY